MFTTDFMVCGVAPYGNQLVILSYDDDDDTAQVIKHITVFRRRLNILFIYVL